MELTVIDLSSGVPPFCFFTKQFYVGFRIFYLWLLYKRIVSSTKYMSWDSSNQEKENQQNMLYRTVSDEFFYFLW